jgi:hypothetical protein
MRTSQIFSIHARKGAVKRIDRLSFTLNAYEALCAMHVPPWNEGISLAIFVKLLRKSGGEDRGREPSVAGSPVTMSAARPANRPPRRSRAI